jgi:hypothetical protein
MSAIAILQKPEALYFATDCASYDIDGVITALDSKVAIIPDIPMAIFTRGPSGASHVAMFEFLDKFATFDQFVDDASATIRKFYYGYESYMRKCGHPDLEFYFFGWSERREQPEGYMIRCGYADSALHSDKKAPGHKRERKYRAKPFVVQSLPIFGHAPGLFGPAEFAVCAFPRGKPADLLPELDLLHVVEMMRHTPTRNGQINVGGSVELTTVNESGITKKTLKKYDDVIGQPIKAIAPLDWKRWRDNQAFRHKLTSPTNRRDGTVGAAK